MQYEVNIRLVFSTHITLPMFIVVVFFLKQNKSQKKNHDRNKHNNHKLSIKETKRKRNTEKIQ